jgi:crossover junction endodeoxyribonuclease RuvC
VFVVGIDPGLKRCGYAVLEVPDRRARVRAMGVLATPSTLATAERLAMLQRDLSALMAEYPPDVVAVERLFFQVNTRTAVAVAQASGLVLAAGAAAGAEVEEYTPNQVKEAVAGWGGATKDQMQRMVQSLLGLDTPPRPADAADAAAVALCHLAHRPRRQRVAAALTTTSIGTAPLGAAP